MKKHIEIFGMVILLTSIIFTGCIENNNSNNNDDNNLNGENPNDSDLNDIELEILIFEPSNKYILPGDSTSLIYAINGADTAFIDNEIGEVDLDYFKDGFTFISVMPTENTTYTLTALNSTSTKNATTDVIIDYSGRLAYPNLSMSLSVESSNDDNVTIKVENVTGIEMDWSDINAELVNVNQNTFVWLKNWNWRPSGKISNGDICIINEVDTDHGFVKGDNYKFILFDNVTRDIFGALVWTQ